MTKKNDKKTNKHCLETIVNVVRNRHGQHFYSTLTSILTSKWAKLGQQINPTADRFQHRLDFVHACSLSGETEADNKKKRRKSSPEHRGLVRVGGFPKVFSRSLCELLVALSPFIGFLGAQIRVMRAARAVRTCWGACLLSTQSVWHGIFVQSFFLPNSRAPRLVGKESRPIGQGSRAVSS